MRARTGKYVKCDGCGSEIYRMPQYLNAKLFFCDNKCKSKYWRQFYKVTCVVCGKEFEKNPAEQKRHPVHCCSIECRSKNNDIQQVAFCLQCGKTVKRPPSQLDGQVFCSQECHNEFQDKKIEICCDGCGVVCYKSPVYINRTKQHYCSIECAAKYVHYGRSIECLFEDFVKRLGIMYTRNDRSVLWERTGRYSFSDRRFKCELDFYIPSLEYGIEINGFTHHTPVYGEERLLAQQQRDRRKRRMCLRAGLKLRTIWIKNPLVAVMRRKFASVIREIRRMYMSPVDEIAELDGSFPGASYAARKDGRTDSEMERDINSGIIRQGERFSAWVDQINKTLSDIVHIRILKLAQPGISKESWRDPGDTEIEMTLFGETRVGKLEVESTPRPSDCYRIKKMTCVKSDRHDRHLWLWHPAMDCADLWRVIAPEECRLWLKSRDFVTNDEHYRGKKPNGPFGGNPEKSYTLLWQKDALWVNVYSCEPRALCVEYLKAIFSKLQPK